MTSNRNFFESPQAAAIYKHKLVKSYIPAWAGKVGSTSHNNRVVVYDAYSGPGRYENAQPGSPELLVDTALAMAELRSVYTVFSEKERSYCDSLRRLMAEKEVPSTSYDIKQGAVEVHLEDVLTSTGDLPLFVFLDPYGLTVPFERVVHVLTSRDRSGYPTTQDQPKTELLMNFSYEAVRRISGALRSNKEYDAKEGQVRSLDRALGGAWWHEIASDEPEGWVSEVLKGYSERIAERTGYSSITADVADSLTASPVYELILFTRHPDGLWKMMNAMSMARKEWRQWLVDQHEQNTGGQAELRGLDWNDDEQAWIDEITRNVELLLKKHSGFTVFEKLDKLLGRTLGLARETHIRKALKALYDREVIASPPKGGMQSFYIARR